jgi:hypothetical protein
LFIISQIPNYPKEKEQLLCLFFSTSQLAKQKEEKKIHSLCLFLSLLRPPPKTSLLFMGC